VRKIIEEIKLEVMGKHDSYIWTNEMVEEAIEIALKRGDDK